MELILDFRVKYEVLDRLLVVKIIHDCRVFSAVKKTHIEIKYHKKEYSKHVSNTLQMSSCSLLFEKQNMLDCLK